MKKCEPNSANIAMWASLIVALPVIYVLTAPALYVVADKIGVPEKPLDVCCAPYDLIGDIDLVAKPLGDYWFFWMRVGYGNY